MTTNPIVQLKQWYDDAEKVTETNLPRPGDTLIFPYNASGYAFEVEEAAWTPEDVVPGETVRIYSRAPKPAWHNAVAVMARSVNAPEGHREPFIHSEASPDVWIGEGGYGYSGDLRDVTPLIEAKVTDEMVERARDYMSINTGQTHTHKAIRGVLTAALGLGAE